ncbi:MAG: hypothetical protein J3Q66DRAFT_117594 [Benniella sp.]|nr:MAG: hypothetical protein J3Q66DRAFT_117594 [Benniella sp.]
MHLQWPWHNLYVDGHLGPLGQPSTWPPILGTLSCPGTFLCVTSLCYSSWRTSGSPNFMGTNFMGNLATIKTTNQRTLRQLDRAFCPLGWGFKRALCRPLLCRHEKPVSTNFIQLSFVQQQRGPSLPGSQWRKPRQSQDHNTHHGRLYHS